jgi:hypothetical protein
MDSLDGSRRMLVYLTVYYLLELKEVACPDSRRLNQTRVGPGVVVYMILHLFAS